MRVVHVEDYFDPTAGYQVNELLNAGRRLGHEVFLITSDKPLACRQIDMAKDKEYESVTGVRILRLPALFQLSGRPFLRGLGSTIRDLEPDLVFMHGIGDFRDLGLWRRKPRWTVVRDCHMSWVASQNPLRNLYYALFRLFFANIINRTDKYARVYALGVEEYEYLRTLGISGTKIRYLYHGYNGEMMYYDSIGRREARTRYGFVDDDVVISYIGKLNYNKRPDLLLDMIDVLEDRCTVPDNVKLLFIGPQDDTYMHFFLGKLGSRRCSISVVLDEAKPFDELRKYYSASDICVFPKQTTLSSIHAQVCGCPVVMEDHRSNRERVVRKDHLYRRDDIADAAMIIEGIIDRREYVKNGSVPAALAEREYGRQVRELMSVVGDERLPRVPTAQ